MRRAEEDGQELVRYFVEEAGTAPSSWTALFGSTQRHRRLAREGSRPLPDAPRDSGAARAAFGQLAGGLAKSK